MIYTQLLEDVVIVPTLNSERIHNRITVFLDKENVDYLYLIRRYSSFLRFNYSKLNIIMKCSKDAEKITDLAFDNKLKEILPGLNFDITMVKEEDSKRVLLGLLEEKKQDFYVLFSEDFFFDFSMEFFTESIDYLSFDAPLLKFAVTPEKIEQYKTGSENRVIFELRDI
jgi:hypothetical protein